MSGDQRNQPATRPFLPGWITAPLSVALMVSGVAGIADGLVEWRDAFAGIVTAYIAARSWLAGFLPLPIPSLLIDYMVIGFGFTTSMVQSANKHRFAIADERWIPRIPAHRLHPINLVFLLEDAMWFLFVCVLWPVTLIVSLIEFAKLVFWRIPKEKIWPNTNDARSNRNLLTHFRQMGRAILVKVCIALIVLFLAADLRATWAS